MKVFLDSSILLEYEKGTKVALLDALRERDVQLYINSIVASEYLYKLVGILGEKSPLTLKERGEIHDVLQNHQTKPFLKIFEYLPVPKPAIYKAVDFMEKYNLLPNDALILASCQLQNVKVLASHDSDFTEACKTEGLFLLTDELDVNTLD